MKHVLKYVLFLILMICPIIAKADVIDSIDMTVYINHDGSASITEIWDTNISQGSELFHPYNNLGNSEITGFSVIDERGNIYAYNSSWDRSSSLKDKAYQVGINKIGKKIELCWGISEYGHKTYTLNYMISNFVNKYTDSQGIYFELISKDMVFTPKNVKITIESDMNLTSDNVGVWGYGYKGNASIEKGKIILQNDGKFSNQDYMVVLVKFEKPLFQTYSVVNKSFAAVKEEADTNLTTVKKDSSKSFGGFIKTIVTMLLVVVGSLLGFILLKKMPTKTKKEKFNYEILNEKPDKIDMLDMSMPSGVPYYSEIPCNRDIYKMIFLLYHYQLVSRKDMRNNVLKALFIKWLSEEKITIIKNSKGIKINASNLSCKDNPIEAEMAVYIKEACGNDEYLDTKEFSKYSMRNIIKLFRWFNRIVNYGKDIYIKEGLVVNPDLNERNRKFKKATPALKEEAIRLLGLKRFLTDFTYMKTKDPLNIELWTEYLIIATLFGLDSKVEARLKEVCPNFEEDTNINFEYIKILNKLADITTSSIEKSLPKDADESLKQKIFSTRVNETMPYQNKEK